MSRYAIAHRTGRLLDAEADLDDALRVTAEGGLGIIDGYVRAQLAAVRLDRGDPRGAAALFADVPDDLGQHRHSDAQFLLFERGRLRLTTGEAAAAVRELLECGNRELTSGTGNPGWIPWRSTAAAALGAVGDPARARALAEEKLVR